MQPLRVVVAAGEWEVILSLLKSSMPVIVGWSHLVEISMQGALGEGRGRPKNEGGGTFRSGTGKVPF